MTTFLDIEFGPTPPMQPIGWKRQVVLVEPQYIKWQGGHLTVPVGFIHNGPSIPNRLRGIVYYTHRLLRPSIVHDYLYSGWGAANGWTRKEADRLFLESLGTENVGFTRRRIMWLAVRAGGWTAWKN